MHRRQDHGGRQGRASAWRALKEWIASGGVWGVELHIRQSVAEALGFVMAPPPTPAVAPDRERALAITKALQPHNPYVACYSGVDPKIAKMLGVPTEGSFDDEVVKAAADTLIYGTGVMHNGERVDPRVVAILSRKALAEPENLSRIEADLRDDIANYFRQEFVSGEGDVIVGRPETLAILLVSLGWRKVR